MLTHQKALSRHLPAHLCQGTWQMHSSCLCLRGPRGAEGTARGGGCSEGGLNSTLVNFKKTKALKMKEGFGRAWPSLTHGTEMAEGWGDCCRESSGGTQAPRPVGAISCAGPRLEPDPSSRAWMPPQQRVFKLLGHLEHPRLRSDGRAPQGRQMGAHAGPRTSLGHPAWS